MPSLFSLTEIANHHVDVEASLRLYFSNANPTFPQRFFSYTLTEITDELSDRINETEMQSALTILARVEAALRRDYLRRCKDKLADDVSIAFRKIHKARGNHARLDDDILKTWYDNLGNSERVVVSRLRGMLKFRHWMAHGRYWNHRPVHSFQDVYLVADLTISTLKLR
ncbi:hypothetical protein M2360_003795 [Rhizobium sp. SG_E_25_P2]|uniref:hypothetical protein n=1 Tax=Rhizobium sp. SG_E_25_P2 TaxID=2879942 RepID=UPI002476F227|nr:hypothetical protein [Rhizobium sp. SG_E_25_P2]MDH6268390.1 hypothetical protein [Rhizobium sp. SG_E_25_P2]